MDIWLHLQLKKIWYRMIESGEKPEEYREITPYWMKRLLLATHISGNHYRPINQDDIDFYCKPENVDILKLDIELGGLVKRYKWVVFALGYPKKNDASRHMTKRIKEIVIGEGRPEWGAKPGKKYFIIKF